MTRFILGMVVALAGISFIEETPCYVWEQVGDALVCVDEDIEWLIDAGSDLVIDDYAIPAMLSFEDNGVTVGELSWENGYLDFSGRVRPAARIFFEHFYAEYIKCEPEILLDLSACQAAFDECK